jgi:hypothetical protein
MPGRAATGTPGNIAIKSDYSVLRTHIMRGTNLEYMEFMLRKEKDWYRQTVRNPKNSSLILD